MSKTTETVHKIKGQLESLNNACHFLEKSTGIYWEVVEEMGKFRIKAKHGELLNYREANLFLSGAIRAIKLTKK